MDGVHGSERTTPRSRPETEATIAVPLGSIPLDAAALGNILDRTEVDEPWAGRNPMRVPKDFCLSREQCAEAVRYFCETGGRDPRVE